MAPQQFEPMLEDEDGWSEWIHPTPGYLMKCCDCGLVHLMEFAIGDPARSVGGVGALNEGEGDGVIIFRASRSRVQQSGPGE